MTDAGVAPAIWAENLSRRFGAPGGPVRAVRGISLAVAPGEIFGFLGPNGAGKTTTVRMLTGQLRPSGGAARVAGCDVVAERSALHRQIGVVFDVPNLYDELTVAENLRLFAALQDAPAARAEALLAELGLAEAARRRFRTLSKGMKQRVGVARALLHGPRVLFADEPTAGLDPGSAERVRARLLAAREGGATVFLTTHDMELADRLCDRIAILHAGRIVAEGTPAALKAAHGQGSVQVQLRTGERHTLPLAGPETAARLAAWLAEDAVASLHTAEPSLEEVFFALTGRPLT